MIRCIWIACFLVLYCAILNGQVDIGISSRVGIGFGTQLEINEANPSRNISFNTRIGAFIEFPVCKSFHFEFGAGGKLFAGKGELQNVNYSFVIARVDVESHFKYYLYNNWVLGVGANLSTHRDFEGLNIHRDDNLRWDGMLNIIYQFSHRVDYAFVYSRTINHRGDSYYLGTPRSGLMIGMRYKIN